MLNGFLEPLNKLWFDHYLNLLQCFLFSMKEHTCKLVNLPQQSRKITGRKPQKLTQKCAGMREGGADEAFRVLGGRDGRAGRVQRDNV